MTEFEQLKADILRCRICWETFGFEPRPIFFGHQKAKIMQISQAPSKTVQETGKPFNDHSGERLRNEWYHIDEKMFYNEDNFYITSMGHCFPGKNKSGGDRLPPRICAQTWMQKELNLVDNRLYILIGKKAADYFFPKRDFADLIMHDQRILSKPTLVLPHPSPLNVKWFIDHPAFEASRVAEIQRQVHQALV